MKNAPTPFVHDDLFNDTAPEPDKEWDGVWINFYAYADGRVHYARAVHPTRAIADAWRARYFRESAYIARNYQLVVGYHMAWEQVVLIPEDKVSDYDGSPIVFARDCVFHVALPTDE